MKEKRNKCPHVSTPKYHPKSKGISGTLDRMQQQTPLCSSQLSIIYYLDKMSTSPKMINC